MILVDTGPLLAYANRSDRHHERCVTYFAGTSLPLVVPDLVVGETAYLLGAILGTGAEAAFLRSFPAELAVEHVTARDMRRAVDLVEQYADLKLGTVDASVIAIAERLGLRTIATLDHRDFSVVRPMHIASFDLVP